MIFDEKCKIMIGLFWAKTGHFGHFSQEYFPGNIKIRNLHEKTVQNLLRNSCPREGAFGRPRRLI